MRTHHALVVSSFLAAFAAAQPANAPYTTHARHADSGWLDHAAAMPAVVFALPVAVPGAVWLRLQFGDTRKVAVSGYRAGEYSNSSLDLTVQALTLGVTRKF